MAKTKQLIFLFGQPGAGKGTQAELLADATGFYHLESSNVLEHAFKTENENKIFEVDGETFKISDEKVLWSTGKLVSPPLVVQLMLEKITELAEEEKSIIFSGSPRTLYEIQKELPIFQKLYGKKSMHFFMLQVSAETTMFRNSHRRICGLARHSILFTGETEHLKLCPLDGSKLVRREGLDEPETIKKRLVEFTERTLPVIGFIEQEGIIVHKINGEPSVAEVHGEIMKVLKK